MWGTAVRVWSAGEMAHVLWQMTNNPLRPREAYSTCRRIDSFRTLEGFTRAGTNTCGRSVVSVLSSLAILGAYERTACAQQGIETGTKCAAEACASTDTVSSQLSGILFN